MSAPRTPAVERYPQTLVAGTFPPGWDATEEADGPPAAPGRRRSIITEHVREKSA